ncbi:transporter substrate-binding domain-containing protein [Lacimicrobium sp. SS2-24]|uniref:substrate-binding periplasmic protein n=1 Tax=Lacimicrobium sp. SS2-24 TaxID=2005569 RepID=UPI00143C2E3F|nr:transporter substrate-binding domain-containing protein [Lacimicrobium sp. SS2-24]
MLGILLAAQGVSSQEIRLLTEHLPPYQVAEQGEVVGGSSYQIMQETFKRAEIKVRHEAMPWARAYRTARNLPNTFIYSMVKSAERASLFHWVGLLHTQHYYYYSLRENNTISLSNIDEARNYIVVSVRDSFAANSLQRHGFEPGRNLILVVSYQAAAEMLKLGRADLIFSNEAALRSVDKVPSQFKSHGDVVETRALYVAANIDSDPMLVDRVARAFASVKADPAFANLFDAGD